MVRESLILLSLLAYSVIVNAQSRETNVWPKKHPKDVVLKKGEFKQEMGKDNILRIQNMPVPTLEKFEVDEKKARDKVVIVCPGGGYSILAVNHEGTEIAEWLNGLGYTAYILRYRVPKDREGALQDAQRAMRIVRSQHPDKKIGIMGFSAGASLSARVATRFDIPSYQSFDEIDQCTSRPDFVGLIYPAYMDLGENRTLTPELTISEQTPPAFVFQTSDDPYGNSALVITQALRDKKVPVELHYYPKGGHGYGLRPQITPVAAEWPKLMEKWLDSLQ